MRKTKQPGPHVSAARNLLKARNALQPLERAQVTELMFQHLYPFQHPGTFFKGVDGHAERTRIRKFLVNEFSKEFAYAWFDWAKAIARESGTNDDWIREIVYDFLTKSFKQDARKELKEAAKKQSTRKN